VKEGDQINELNNVPSILTTSPQYRSATQPTGGLIRFGVFRSSVRRGGSTAGSGGGRTVEPASTFEPVKRFVTGSSGEQAKVQRER